MASPPSWERDRRLENELIELLKSTRLNALSVTQRRGFDQASIARAIPAHATSVYQWENGVCYPGTFKTWQRWAAALGLELVVELRVARGAGE